MEFPKSQKPLRVAGKANRIRGKLKKLGRSPKLEAAALTPFVKSPPPYILPTKSISLVNSLHKNCWVLLKRSLASNEGGFMKLTVTNLGNLKEFFTFLIFILLVVSSSAFGASNQRRADGIGLNYLDLKSACRDAANNAVFGKCFGKEVEIVGGHTISTDYIEGNRTSAYQCSVQIYYVCQ